MLERLKKEINSLEDLRRSIEKNISLCGDDDGLLKKLLDNTKEKIASKNVEMDELFKKSAKAAENNIVKGKRFSTGSLAFYYPKHDGNIMEKNFSWAGCLVEIMGEEQNDSGEPVFLIKNVEVTDGIETAKKAFETELCEASVSCGIDGWEWKSYDNRLFLVSPQGFPWFIRDKESGEYRITPFSSSIPFSLHSNEEDYKTYAEESLRRILSQEKMTLYCAAPMAAGILIESVRRGFLKGENVAETQTIHMIEGSDGIAHILNLSVVLIGGIYYVKAELDGYKSESCMLDGIGDTIKEISSMICRLCYGKRIVQKSLLYHNPCLFNISFEMLFNQKNLMDSAHDYFKNEERRNFYNGIGILDDGVIRIPVADGLIIAERSPDLEYKGIYLTFRDKKGMDVSTCLLERYGGKMVLRVWSPNVEDGGDPDYVIPMG